MCIHPQIPSIHLFILLPTHQPIYPSTHTTIHLQTQASIHNHPFIQPASHSSIYTPTYASNHTSIRLFTLFYRKLPEPYLTFTYIALPFRTSHYFALIILPYIYLTYLPFIILPCITLPCLSKVTFVLHVYYFTLHYIAQVILPSIDKT